MKRKITITAATLLMITMTVTLVYASYNFLWNSQFSWGWNYWGTNPTGPFNGVVYDYYGSSNINNGIAYQYCSANGPYYWEGGGFCNTWLGQGYHIWSYPNQYWGRPISLTPLNNFVKAEGSSRRVGYMPYKTDGMGKYGLNFYGQSLDGQGKGYYNFKFLELWLLFDAEGIDQPLTPNGAVTIQAVTNEGAHNRYAIRARVWSDIGTSFTYWQFSPYMWDQIRFSLWTMGVNPADFGIYGMTGLTVEVHNAGYQGQTDWVSVTIA